MSVEIVSGDLFESGADALVNCVNCGGISGAGLALEFKRRFPRMHTDYKRYCLSGYLQPGGLYIWGSDPKIINFATKDDWRDPSRIEWIARGLYALGAICLGSPSIHTVALPKIGCGYGGLSFDDVRPLIEAQFRDVAVRVLLYV